MVPRYRNTKEIVSKLNKIPLKRAEIANSFACARI
jgi:hypothetical protein